MVKKSKDPKENKPTYQDWQAAYAALGSYGQQVERLAQESAGLVESVKGSPLDDGDSGLVLERLVSLNQEKAAVLNKGRETAEKRLRSLNDPKNLESILASVGDNEKAAMLGVYPVDPEKAGVYKEAAEVFRELQNIGKTIEYFTKGNMKHGSEEQVTQYALKTIKEHYEQKYPDVAEDEETTSNNKFWRTLVFNSIITSRQGGIRDKFLEIASEKAKEKNKQFYKLIGGIKGLDNYFKATLTDDKSITQFYATLAQVYEQEMEAPAYALPLGK